MSSGRRKRSEDAKGGDEEGDSMTTVTPRKTQRWTVKSVVESPFWMGWPPSQVEMEERALGILRSLMSTGGGELSLEEGGGEKAFVQPESNPRSSTISRKSRQTKLVGMIFGLNEVTRALEQGKVDVVVAARDVKPAVMTHHVPVLCYLRCAELVVVSGGGWALAQVFGLKRLIALGFQVECPGTLKSAKHELRKLAGTLHFPWLAGARQTPKPKADEGAQ
mmetsp:Transcript_2819/g.5226  ORF Transcript_2819/g.5226 Transcript_2819/m.5226 type:complete len:221 (-) Transcript_2819:2018-2680(-)